MRPIPGTGHFARNGLGLTAGRGDMTIDFSQLYAALGLHPDCSLEAFQRAYRQRLSECHPDRIHSKPIAPAALPLSELIALHSSAITFYRAHGRLPGSAIATPVQHATPVSRTAIDGTAPHHDRSTAWRWIFALVLLTGSLLLGVMHEQSQPGPDTAASTPQADSTNRLAVRSDLAEGPLELGMDPATIRAIQGEPMRSNGGTWEYGPSWLRIEHGELVDWYSSPLYRLKTRTPSPDVDRESSTSYKR